MPITWTPPFHHNLNELQLPGEIMTFNRGSRISVFSTLFHYESKSICNQDLLMGSNCRCFFSGTWRQPNNETKWLNWTGWNTCRHIIYLSKGQGRGVVVVFKKQSPACGCPSLQNSNSLIHCSEHRVGLLFNMPMKSGWCDSNTDPMQSPWQRPGAALIVSDREIKDQDGELY